MYCYTEGAGGPITFLVSYRGIMSQLLKDYPTPLAMPNLFVPKLSAEHSRAICRSD